MTDDSTSPTNGSTRSNAAATQESPTTSAEQLAKVRALHWWVEGSFERARGECGPDEYEVRNRRGRHHHTALVMTALWCLERLREELGEKDPEMTLAEVRSHLQERLNVREWDNETVLW